MVLPIVSIETVRWLAAEKGGAGVEKSAGFDDRDAISILCFPGPSRRPSAEADPGSLPVADLRKSLGVN
jgi:hypothetical protein